MKCPYCGDENPKSANYCEECGKKLPEEQIKASDRTNTVNMNYKPSKQGRIKNKIIIAVVCIFVVIVLAGFYAFSQQSSPSAAPQNATVFILNQVSGASEIIDDSGTVYPIIVSSYSIGGGSGFIINKEGYIATAAHVISDPKTLKTENRIKKLDSSDLEYYVNKAAVYLFLEQTQPDTVSNITEEQLDQLTSEAMANGRVRAKRFDHDIYVMGPAFPDSDKNPNKAQVIEIGAVNSGVDVTLLKLNNVNTNLPVLSVRSEKIDVGENVHIFGYPTEQFSFYEGLNETTQTEDIWKSMFTATLTRGIVSAERTWTGGIKFYQTDAAVDHSNSGGPVLDDNNEVIGILVMGFEKQGFNFFLPSEYLIELCNKKGISLEGVSSSIFGL
ncbi:trypsin-like peptidase domain-containing protein [Methanobacterium sp. ACI-7]|uniref:trypsin-like peptidase domain-containing protein n=1 Tax=unclassified Methanobacterium TaxID=2627676 RepID=UPI0039C09C66